VYAAGSGTSFADSTVAASSTYCYRFVGEDAGAYSAGVLAWVTTATDTGFRMPTSIVSTVFSQATNAFLSDNKHAKSNNQKDLQDYNRFNFGIPPEATILGIQVGAEWMSQNDGNQAGVGVELSWNGAAGYTLTGNTALWSQKTDTHSVFGGPNNLWGRQSWLGSELGEDVFSVRIEALTSKATMLDCVTCRVWYVVVPPMVSISAAANVTATSATIGGQVSAGTPTPSAFLCWGTSDGGTTPTSWDTTVPMGTQSGAFSTSIAGLLANKTYYYRAFASNVAGIAWAETTGQFTTQQPAVFLTNAPSSVPEQTAKYTINVGLSAESAVPVSLNYTTSAGTATAGSDYTTVSGTLTWLANDTALKTIEVPIINDSDDESDETFSILLNSPSACTVSIGAAETAITDDDGNATVRFAEPESSALESVTSPSILITASPPPTSDVTINYTVTDVSALNGVDYVLASGSVVLSANSASTTIDFTVDDDTSDENDESFTVSITGVSGANLGLYTVHTYAIVDDDFSLPQVSNGKGAAAIYATNATLRGELLTTGGQNPNVWVHWGTTDGGTEPGSWEHSIPMGTLGPQTFTTNITALTSSQVYYYRCSAQNSAGTAWAESSETFVALNPPTVELLANPGFETQGGTAAQAANWSSLNANVARAGSPVKTGTSSLHYNVVSGTYIYGSGDNDFTVSWNGKISGGTHTGGGVRPGFVLDGSVWTVNDNNNPSTVTRFTYRWRNVTDATTWMQDSSTHKSKTYTQFSVANALPVPVADAGDNCRPELWRDTSASGETACHADDARIQATMPRMNLSRTPGTIDFGVIPLGSTSNLSFGVSAQGGNENTVLYGAYITDDADLVSPSWNCRAWYVYEDAGNAFAVVSGEALVAVNGDGYHYAVVGFTPTCEGPFVAKLHVATTDPVDRYAGGAKIKNTIVYEEYTLIGIGTNLPALTAAPTSIEFTACQGSLPSAQNFTVANTWGGVLNYTNTIVYGAGASGWLNVLPETASGLENGDEQANDLSVTVATLSPGTYHATNRITGTQTNGTVSVSVRYTVTAILDPSSPAATTNADNKATRVDLSWSLNGLGHDVVVVRSTDANFFTPSPGTPYPVGYTSGDDLVIYGGSGTATTDSGLGPNTAYHYKLFSRNGNCYSPGVTTSAATGMPDAGNAAGGPPEQPSEVYLGDAGHVFGADMWATVDGNQGRSRVVVHTSTDLSGGTAGSYTTFSSDVHRQPRSPQFTATGTWYWGIQTEYQTFGSAFWYCADSAAMRPMVSAPASTLSVTVLPVPEPTGTGASANPSNPQTAIDVSWTKWNGSDVLVVRGPDSSFFVPANGSDYEEGHVSGDDVVIYHGGALSSVVDSGLSPGTRYYYKVFSANNLYYSAGVVTSATTADAAVPGGSGTVIMFK
jgi:hypothetical protein